MPVRLREQTNFVLWAAEFEIPVAPGMIGSSSNTRTRIGRSVRLLFVFSGFREVLVHPYTFCLPVLLIFVSFSGAGSIRSESAAEKILRQSERASAEGQYEKSATLARHAEQMFRDAGDVQGEAASTNQIGLASLYRADYPRALEYFEAALQLDRQIRDLEQQVVHLNNIANVYQFQGRYSDALAGYKQALSLSDPKRPDAWRPRRYSITAINIGVLYEAVGQNEEALKFYRSAEQFGSHLLPDERGQLLMNIGTISRRLGDHVQALRSYVQARAVFANARQFDREINVITNIGVVSSLDLHDYVRADRFFSEAIRLAETTKNPRREALSRLYRARSRFREGLNLLARDDYSVALQIAERASLPEEQWTALFGLGQILDRERKPREAIANYRYAIALIESMRSSLRQPTLRSEFLGNKRDVYDACIGLLLDQADVDKEQVLALMEQARERRLQDKVEPGGRRDIKSLRALLNPEDALLEFWVGPGRIARVLLTSSGVKLATSFLTPDQQKAIQSLPGAITDADGTWQPFSRILGKLLVPTPEDLLNIRHLIIVPDGPVSSIPFETLIVRDTLLIETMDVSYLPASALLQPRLSRKLPIMPWQRQLLAFGNPLARSPGQVLTPLLRYSKQEIDNIGDLANGRKFLHEGRDDLKRYLTRLESPVRVIHISTHALNNELDPKLSTLSFSPENGISGSDALSLTEVHQLSLQGTNLLTLSACSTEKGKITPGEGLHSFGRGFLAAGARSTVTTLWPVEDQASAEFMKQFYYFLSQDNEKASALRLAKLKFIRSGSEWSQPRFWAPFVLNGAACESVGNPLSWWSLSLALLGALTSTVAGVVYVRSRFARVRRSLTATY
jgi:tetratricopeptide (TPR) repeat protein